MYLLALALVRLIRTLHSTSILPHRLRRAGHGRVSLKGREVYKSALAPSIRRGGTRAGLPRRPETDRGRLAFGLTGAPPGPGRLWRPGPDRVATGGARGGQGTLRAAPVRAVPRTRRGPGLDSLRAARARIRRGQTPPLGRRRRWAHRAGRAHSSGFPEMGYPHNPQEMRVARGVCFRLPNILHSLCDNLWITCRKTCKRTIAGSGKTRAVVCGLDGIPRR